MNNNKISVQTIVNAPIAKVWEAWTKPEHIVHWAFAQDDWEAPAAENDLRVGGKFKTVMAAKDKSASFDFAGVYTAVEEHKLIEYDFGDRHSKVEFEELPESVKVTVTFDPEQENSEERQKAGWQGISNNFKKYTESI